MRSFFFFFFNTALSLKPLRELFSFLYADLWPLFFSDLRPEGVPAGRLHWAGPAGVWTDGGYEHWSLTDPVPNRYIHKFIHSEETRTPRLMLTVGTFDVSFKFVYFLRVGEAKLQGTCKLTNVYTKFKIKPLVSHTRLFSSTFPTLWEACWAYWALETMTFIYFLHPNEP